MAGNEKEELLVGEGSLYPRQRAYHLVSGFSIHVVVAQPRGSQN